jgi:hypothetical protein
VLAELVWDCRGRVASQKQGDEGDSAHHVVNWSHIKAQYWARLVQFDHLSVLHRSMDGQVQLLKRAEKDEVEQEAIRADFVRPVLRLQSASRTQVALEEELGACIPTVFKRDIVYIFCDAVRIWRDHDNGVLHTPQPLSTGVITI